MAKLLGDGTKWWLGQAGLAMLDGLCRGLTK